MMVSSSRLREYSLVIAVFMTILSQAPFFRSVLLIDTQTIIFPVWGMVFCVSYFENTTLGKWFVGKLILCFSMIVFLFFSFEVITENNYFGSVMLPPIITATFLMLIGRLNADVVSFELLKKLCFMYITATTIVCIDVYFNNLRGVDFQIINYVFKAKNSLGQIVLTAIIFLFFIVKTQGIRKIIKYIVIALLFTIIVLLRSRATIVSSVLIPIVYLTQKNIKNKHKYISLFILGSILLILTFNNQAFNFFIKNILLNTGSEIELSQLDLYRVTSNRQDYFIIFKTIMRTDAMFGIGNYYMDNFFLSIIINFGIPVGGMFILYAFYPIKVSFSLKDVPVALELTVKSIALIYVANALFECLSPFGPGAKTFILWFLVGVLSSNKNILTNPRENYYAK